MFSRASRGALFAVRTRCGEMRREILRGDRDREKEEGKGVKRQPERNDGEREGERGWRGKEGEREREREKGGNTELSGIDLVVGVRPGAEQGHRCFSASTGLASEPPAPEPPLRISLDSTGHRMLSGNSASN